ncbi:MAG: hypothetical protein KJ771_09105 [Nanoarchaeota archaeon]|nr:hypothetical protein [Nanoarchaeota archaeon]
MALFGTLFGKVFTKQKKMKKNSVKKFSKSLMSASLRGLTVFAVFGMALYAYAVNYPSSQPNPVSGVVGLYVGQTAGTWDGNIGGYQAANAVCAGVEPDSHICSPMEIVNTYNHNASSVTAETGTVWVNSGAPANTSPAVNDCNGWKNNSLSYYGNVWSFGSNDFAGILPCAFALPIACCK